MTLYTIIPSPLDPILLLSNGTALTGLYLSDRDGNLPIDPGWQRDDAAAPFDAARQQLAAYFDGELQQFNLPLAPVGTPFQQQVWHALGQISYGKTTSYGELARRIGNPLGSRAVGLANGRNPLSIIVPCHRVIGANGKLTGYGGGLDRKRALLGWEASVLAHGPHSFTTTAQEMLL
jgi:methylated-DNA-[protein]-cysteine S-methyltransferase